MSEDHLYLSPEDLEEGDLVIGEDSSSSHDSSSQTSDDGEDLNDDVNEEDAEDDSDEEEDISPNDIGPHKSFNIPITGSPQNGHQTNKQSSSDVLSKLQELYTERSAILTYIEEEDRQRKWYISQLDNVRQRLEKVPLTDGYPKDKELMRRKIEYEGKQIQEMFLQNLGTAEQISQRQELRLSRISSIETEMLELQKTKKLKVGGEKEGSGLIYQEENVGVSIASLYHGAWPLSTNTKDGSREGSSHGSGHQEIASIMSFNSANTSTSQPSQAPQSPRQHGQPLMSGAFTMSQGHPTDGIPTGQTPQQLGTKVEMVYSLLSMLGTHDKDDMSRTLLAMSSSQDSCIAMRQSGCLPLLIQLLHGSDKDSGLLGNTRGSKAARERAAAALHNIVHSHPDDKRGRREARVLRFLEQIRAHCDQLREIQNDGQEMSEDMDHQPGPAVAALMKLSFDEEHRHAICSLGGVQAIAELLEVDHGVHHTEVELYNITMRRYGCMALTNLTFGDGTNKALLCSMRSFMEALVAQLHCECEDLNQVAASVLRNLSWKADLQSKKTLRAVGAATKLMGAAMRVKKEATLKSILSALWNLSAHGSENKAEICAVEGALEFLVGTLTYKSPSKTTAVIENGGGVLRNISSHITVREDYRQILRKHGCLQILLKQLRSPSLNIVSNACGTLWNLSARCAEDQKALLDMGAVGMLRNLVNSKHQMISMGSSAALKNLLTACNIKTMGMDKKAFSNRPSLHVRKQKALAEEIDQSLSETCENVESPRDSPTENGRSDKDQSRFHFPANSGVVCNDGETPRTQNRGHSFPKSLSGENTPMSDSHLMSPHRVARSGSQDSVGSTHSDISHDRTRFHMAMKKAKSMTGRQGGSLDRQQGSMIPRVHSDGSCEETPQPSSRIIQVMKEVAKHAGIDSDSSSKGSSHSQSNTPRKMDPSYSFSQSLLVRSYTGPSLSQGHGASFVGQFGKLSYSSSMDSDQPIDYSLNKAIKSPIPLKYGNYVGQSYEQHMNPVNMHHSYNGPQKSAQNLFNLTPIVQHSSVYAETDLDCEQPTDYSRRFAESHEDSDGDQPYDLRYEDNCADCKLDIARRTNDRLEFLPGYNDDQIKTFCTEGTPRNYLSTANSLTDLSKGEKEDTQKEHTDEEEEEDYQYEEESGSIEKRSGSGSQSTNQNTGTTVIASYHVATKNLQQVACSKSPSQDESISRSFHAPNENDNSPDQVKTYCEEGTPICFSRVSSLSSLHSSEAQDRQVESNRSNLRNSRGLHSIDENDSAKTPPRDVKMVSSIMAPPKYTQNSGRQKLMSESDSQGPDSAEKEHKTVTFNDDHQIQETPLMFSRCSSLGSLSSFDAYSVHSSVISDYSRRASEVVSPSELPDSPSETMPPSPSKSPDPELQQNTNNSQKFESFIEGTPKTVLYRPVPTKVSNENKLANIEIASTISRDEAPVVYADEGTPPHMSETNSVLSTLTIDDANKAKATDKTKLEKTAVNGNLKSEEEADDKENSQSEVSVYEEDILKECIRTAMPRKPRRSSSDNTLKKKTVNNADNQNKLSQSVEGIKLAPKAKIGSGLHSSVNEAMESESDCVRTYASEDFPSNIQIQIQRGVANKVPKSLLNEKGVNEYSGDSVKAFAEEDVPFSEKMKTSIKTPVKPEPLKNGSCQLITMEENLDSVTSYASEGQPSSKPVQTAKHYKKVKEILNGNLDVLESHDDDVKLYADEDTPFQGSAAMSVHHSQNKPHILQNTVRFNPALLSQMDYLFDDEEAPRSYAMEDTPYNLSEPTSPKNTVKKAPPPVPQKPIRPNNVPKFNPSLLSQIQDVPDDDAPKSYAVEDTPYNMSKPTSPTPKVQINSLPSTESAQPVCLVKPMVHVEDPATYCEDTIKTYATEDTPINFSHSTSLSDLSIITGMSEPIKEEEPDTGKSDAQEVFKAKEPEKEEEEEDKSADLNDSKSDSSYSDGSEDLLSDLIQSAMPKGSTSPKARVSRKLDMDRAAEGAESKFQPQRTSSVVTAPKETKYTSQSKKEKTSSDISSTSEMPSRIQSVNTSEIKVSYKTLSHNTEGGDDSVFYHTTDSLDSVKVYDVEGTPITFSRNDSLSSLSIIDGDVKQTSKTELSDSAKKMPPPAYNLKTEKSEIGLQREVEGQSSDEVSTASAQKSDEKSLSNDNKSNSDDDDDDADDEALLAACMNLALPKSKSSTFAEKSKSSSKPLKSNQVLTGSKSFNSSFSSERPKKSTTSKKTSENHKQRMNKSTSAVEGHLNLSIGSVMSHHSRAADWQVQQTLNMSDDFNFAKPSPNYRRVRPHQGSWRRSRSQDSDGFLKQQKENTNMELAYSNGGPRIHHRVSAQSIPSYVDVCVDNRFIEEHHTYTQHKYHLENQQGVQSFTNQNVERADQGQSRHYTNTETHKRSHSESREKSGRQQHNQAIYDLQVKRRHHSEQNRTEKFSVVNVHVPAPQEEIDSLNRSIYQMEHNNEALTYGIGIDNFGFGIGGSQEEVCEEDRLDSADVTLKAASGNNTMTNDSINQNDSIIHYDKNTLSPEDERALHLDASAVVTEIQNKRMLGSGVDEDLFIEHETLSLVSGGYMSDTPSDASITWSAHSENYSESTLEENSVASSGPRVVKPDNRGTTIPDNSKAIRGKRKPLYSRSNSTTSQKSDTANRVVKPTTASTRISPGGRGGSVTAGAIRRTPQTRTHPQASSTPTKNSPPKPKIQKSSPPQGKTTVRANNTKESPSRLPLASNRKSSAERPKPPIKQGTFTKEASAVKVPVIDDSVNENCYDASIEAVKNETNKQGNTPGMNSIEGTESWKKALGSYNFVIDNAADEKKENLTPNKKVSGVTNLNSKKSGSGSNLSASKSKTGGSPANKGTVKTANRVNSTSNLKKAYSGTSLTKYGSGASLNKSGSGSTLNKSGSGQLLNKSGSALHKLTGSDRGLNRGGSNPNLGRLNSSKPDLKKSDSNASLRNNSRPSTPVGRRTSAGSVQGRKSESNTSKGVTPSEKKTGPPKKQVGSKIAGLWKKDDSTDTSSPHTSTSKLPVSTTPSRQRNVSTSGIKKSSNASLQSLNKSMNSAETLNEGISRSSTYDKINSTMDSSQLPSLDKEDDAENVTIELTKSSVVLGDEIKGDYVELRIIQGSESDFDMNKSIVIKSPNKSKSDSDSVTSPSAASVKSQSSEEFDLKSLEKRIDSSTWKKKKSDLALVNLPNADETSKSLEAVKALLDASLASESSNMTLSSSFYNTSNIQGSYLSQGSRTVNGTAWRRYKQESFASVDHSEDEGDSIWVRRDPESSKSEPELNKHSLNAKIDKKEKADGKSFLPIKAMKNVFSSSKKDKSSKSGSKLSLSSSKESLHSNKINMNEIVKAVEKEREKDKEREKKEKAKQKEKIALEKAKAKEAAKLEKEKAKNEKEKAKMEKEKAKMEKEKAKAEKMKNNKKSDSRKSSVADESFISKDCDTSKSQDVFSFVNHKASPPQAALVQPFNYTPKESEKHVNDSVVSETLDQSFSRPPNSAATTSGPPPGTNTHMTKTEMLLARRRMNSINNTEGETCREEGKKKTGCMVTTV
ncbi:adenomatous polyposis coli protein-like isoform X2 [Saccostrea echinata]|uniref:adenomatous polyposis coli protein-like isoform X2 n=1 Tax=Saccostrea echinata TaxID=191078 RepID=UPI002A825A4C|nr:adenomatous polyposis coli protein-like isoform X2 [Saccostrea echinata]